jgi:predicted ester cyclase
VEQLSLPLIDLLATDHAALTLADDVVLRDQAQRREFVGRSAVEAMLHGFFTHGFSETRIEIDCLLVDQRAAVLAFVLNGRQTGSFLSLPVTGRTVAVPMTLVCHLSRNQVYQAALYYDAGTLLGQLGLAL